MFSRVSLKSLGFTNYYFNLNGTRLAWKGCQDGFPPNQNDAERLLIRFSLSLTNNLILFPYISHISNIQYRTEEEQFSLKIHNLKKPEFLPQKTRGCQSAAESPQRMFGWKRTPGVGDFWITINIYQTENRCLQNIWGFHEVTSFLCDSTLVPRLSSKLLINLEEVEKMGENSTMCKM